MPLLMKYFKREVKELRSMKITGLGFIEEEYCRVGVRRGICSDLEILKRYPKLSEVCGRLKQEERGFEALHQISCKELLGYLEYLGGYERSWLFRTGYKVRLMRN